MNISVKSIERAISSEIKQYNFDCALEHNIEMAQNLYLCFFFQNKMRRKKLPLFSINECGSLKDFLAFTLDIRCDNGS